MTQFKVGDRVRVFANPYKTWVTEISDIDEFGRIKFKNWYDGRPGAVFWQEGSFYSVTLMEKTMDNLQVGDVLVDYDNDEVKVLAVLGDLYGVSGYNDFESFGYWRTKSDLNGYNIKIDVEELTVEEVSKRLGKTVKIVEG